MIALRRSLTLATAAFLVVLPSSAFGISGGVSADEVLAAEGSGRYTEQQTAFAYAVSAVTVPLARFDAAGRSMGMCSSTIIHPRVVLTAAHCVMDGREVINRMSVYFDGGKSKRQALDVVVHPLFLRLVQDRAYKAGAESLGRYLKRSGPNYVSSDLALVLLHRDVPENHDVVVPVRAGFRDTRSAQKLIAGYGQTDGGASAKRPALHFAEVQGNTRMDEGALSGGDEIIMTSRYRNGARVNACKGDSGGPVLVLDRASSGLRQLAVTSAGDDNCREIAAFASIDGQRATLRQMFDTLMQGEQGAGENPF
jgi:hypothetical protein